MNVGSANSTAVYGKNKEQVEGVLTPLVTSPVHVLACAWQTNIITKSATRRRRNARVKRVCTFLTVRNFGEFVE